MSAEVLIAVIGAAVALAGLVTFFLKRPKKDLDRQHFRKQWKELQKQCAKAETWALAVIQADSLLDEALKKKRFKGKTMGERLVSAQRSLTNNDGVWFGHKLRNQLVHQTDVALREKDIRHALIGIGQALKDLGAL
ncbi:MAG: hypothetical protein JWO47_634 [Candidatus Saccharibacteria bacterium]|nr:hypothetical protein [Candidatus Saccharibacteria bacterium]